MVPRVSLIGFQRLVTWWLLALLLYGMEAAAQVTAGENFHMNLNGSVGVGYNGSFGNADIQSGHGQGVNGNGELTGYYFDPNFLNFQVRPYYDRSQSNTDSQIITRGTGISGTVGLFGGSHFPGSISFGKDFSSGSTFQIAGIPTVVQDSSSQTFGIGWSANIKDLPWISASYGRGSSQSEFAGMESNSWSQNENLNSGYQVAGFTLAGNLSHNNSSYQTPEFLTAEFLKGGSDGTSYGLSASHQLPLNGGLTLGWSHSHSEGSNGYGYGTTFYTAGTTFTPWRRLTFFQNGTYATDVSALLAQTILHDATVSNLSDTGSIGVFYDAGAGLFVGHGVNVSGRFNHRVQWLMGVRYEDSQFGGNLNYNYAHKFLGMLYFSFGLTDTASQRGNNGLGYTANVGMGRRFGHWETNSDFSYAQNVVTLGTLATTSSYSFGTSLKRKISNQLRVGGSFRGSHSGLSVQEGNSNHAESGSGMVMWGRWGFNGSYSQSAGTSILTTTGELRSTPLASLLTNDFLLVNARAYAGSASTLLFRRLSIAGGYSKFRSSTLHGPVGVIDSGSRYSVQIQYRLRKFSFTGGLSHYSQSVSTIAGQPRAATAYYFSVNRWFNVF
jgi:hypothetical protein